MSSETGAKVARLSRGTLVWNPVLVCGLACRLPNRVKDSLRFYVDTGILAGPRGGKRRVGSVRA
jgi:hypothetical protein